MAADSVRPEDYRRRRITPLGAIIEALEQALVFRRPAARDAAPLAHAPRGVSPHTLTDWMAAGRDVQVLDVRSAQEYHGPDGRIEPSTLVPLDELEGRLPELELHRAQPVVVV
jgi:hypothetical protein